MVFYLAFTKSDKQFYLKEYSQDLPNSKGKVIDYSEISDFPIDLLIYGKEYLSEELHALFNEEHRFYPIRSAEEFGLQIDDIEGLPYSHALGLLNKAHDNWKLQNNISTLDKLMPLLDHFQDLLARDRTAFFEELWFILKNNLGAYELTIIYNDLVKAEKEGEKNKLIRAKIIGERMPNPVPAESIDEEIFMNYDKEFGPSFQISEFDSSKGQLVMACTIKKSPVLIISKIRGLSKLQEALVKAIFEGLDR